MATETDSPIEVLTERIVMLEIEMADIRAWFASRGHSYSGLSDALPKPGDGPGEGD